MIFVVQENVALLRTKRWLEVCVCLRRVTIQFPVWESILAFTCFWLIFLLLTVTHFVSFQFVSLYSNRWTGFFTWVFRFRNRIKATGGIRIKVKTDGPFRGMRLDSNVVRGKMVTLFSKKSLRISKRLECQKFWKLNLEFHNNNTGEGAASDRYLTFLLGSTVGSQLKSIL